MRKRLALFLIAIFALTVLLPSAAFAATDYEKVLNGLKATDVTKYDKPLPTNGKKATQKAITAIINKIPYKLSGSGTTEYNYSLFFTSGSSMPEGATLPYDSISKNKNYFLYNTKTKLYKSRGIDKLIYTSYGNLSTLNSLFYDDKTYTYFYSWDEGASNGYYNKSKKTTSTGSGSTKWLNAKTYADQTINGQKCFVYSYAAKYGSATDTSYVFMSRKNGQIMKMINVGSEGYKSTTILFAYKKMSKASSFYTKPKGIVFSSTYN